MIEINNVLEYAKRWLSFGDNSEIWVYQANRKLNEMEISEINQAAAFFVSKWNSHGVKVNGDFQVIMGRFVVFLADKDNSPSGCSKDSMVHFIEDLGKKYSIDFFDRMGVAYLSANGGIEICHLHELAAKIKNGAITEKTIVFDNLVNTKGEFNKKWMVSIKDSWHSNFV